MFRTRASAAAVRLDFCCFGHHAARLYLLSTIRFLFFALRENLALIVVLKERERNREVEGHRERMVLLEIVWFCKRKKIAVVVLRVG